MAKRENTRIRSRLLDVHHYLATRTFELEHSDAVPRQLLAPSISHRTDLSTWLAHKSANARGPARGPAIGRIQLALVDLNPGLWIENGHPESYLLDLLREFRIPQIAYTRDDIVIARAFPPTLDEYGSTPSNEVLTQSVACNTSGLAWKYFPQTLTGVGILWSIDQEGRGEVEYILQQAEELQSLSFSSFAPLTSRLEAMTISMRHWVDDQKIQVMEAQIDSGYHQYASLSTGIYTDHARLGEFSASVSGLSANIVTSELCLQGLHDLAMSILDQNSSLAKSQPAADIARMELAACYVERQTKHWAEECAFLQQEAASWQRKASIVIQGIFNLIAQRDQNMSISIAKDSKMLAEQSQRIAHESKVLAEKSKRDSTSMNSIAAVTIFFLPGTFVAVCYPFVRLSPYALTRVYSRSSPCPCFSGMRRRTAL